MIESIGGDMQQMQMMQQMRQQMQQKMQAADTDGTQGLSKDELSSLSEEFKSEGTGDVSFIEQLLENFEQFDSNGDGQLTEKEGLSGMQSAGIQPPGGPPPGMFDEGGKPPPMMPQETDGEESYIDKLMESFLSSGSKDEEDETVSYVV